MTRKTAIITICTAILVMVLAACSGGGAKGEVKDELAALQTSVPASASLAEIKGNLPQDAGEDFDAFLAKVRDFDYKILGNEVKNDGDGAYTLVTVKITSYDFGREYLATWKDYLSSHRDASKEDAEGSEFYTELFSRLAKLEDKNHVSFIERFFKACEITGTRCFGVVIYEFHRVDVNRIHVRESLAHIILNCPQKMCFTKATLTINK